MDTVWCRVYRAQGLFQRLSFFLIFPYIQIVFLLAIKWKSIVLSPSIAVPVTLFIKYKKAECRSDKCPVLLMSDQAMLQPGEKLLLSGSVLAWEFVWSYDGY